MARYYLSCAVCRCFISNIGQRATWRSSDSHRIINNLHTSLSLLKYVGSLRGTGWVLATVKDIKVLWDKSHNSSSLHLQCLPPQFSLLVLLLLHYHLSMLWDRAEALLKSKTLSSRRKAATHHHVLPRTMTPVWRGRDGSWLLTEIRKQQPEHTWCTG